MDDRQRLYTVMAVVVIVVVVLGCVVGAAAGALTGLVVGRQQGRHAAQEAIALAREFQAQPEAVPVPLPEEPGLTPRFEVPSDIAQGAVVLEVIADTPAEQAGLQAGDVIVAVDQIPIDANHYLGDVLPQYQPGDRVTLEVWRAGERTTLRAVLGEHPTRQGPPYLGIRYQMNTGLELDPPGD